MTPLQIPVHAIVVCKCVTCGTMAEFRFDEVPQDGPVCERCCGPMVVVRVKGR